jgi:hypothetical protein
VAVRRSIRYKPACKVPVPSVTSLTSLCHKPIEWENRLNISCILYSDFFIAGNSLRAVYSDQQTFVAT